MKKTYVMPALHVSEAEVTNMMAVSIQDGNADGGKPVLTKEDTSWDLWGEGEE